MGCATRELLHLVLRDISPRCHIIAYRRSSPRAGGSSSDRAFARLRPLPSGFGYAIVTADSVEAPLLDTDALVVVLKQARHVVSPAPVLRRRRDAAHRTSPGRADQIA